jgi:DNA-binding NarL/FixJ family response regulator
MTIRTVSPSEHVPHRVRLLLVDDMPQVLQDLRQLLELTGLVEVVGEARDGAEAVCKVVELLPDVVLMDLEMPGMDGYEATRRIKSQAGGGRAHDVRAHDVRAHDVRAHDVRAHDVRAHDVRVIILSVHAELEERRRALAAGADGFVTKGANYEILMDAILPKEGSDGK